MDAKELAEKIASLSPEARIEFVIELLNDAAIVSTLIGIDLEDFIRASAETYTTVAGDELEEFDLNITISPPEPAVEDVEAAPAEEPAHKRKMVH